MKRMTTAFLAMSMTLLAAADAVAAEQTVCPVLEGNPINREIFADYQGQRVYFCCASCKASFLEAPKKYLARLPQFSTPVDHQEDAHAAHQRHNGHFNTASLIVPLGISTFVFMTATLLAGAFVKRRRNLLLPWHRRLAVVTLLVAIAHVACILLAH